MRPLVGTVAVVFLTSGKVVMSTLLFSGQQRWDPLALLGAISPKACVLLIPWAAGEIYYTDATDQMLHLSAYMIFLLSLSGVAAFFLNWNNFGIFKYLDSPVSVAVFTNTRKVATIAVGICLFEKELGFLNILGVLTTFLGVFLYSRNELMEKRAANFRNRSKLDTIV